MTNDSVKVQPHARQTSEIILHKGSASCPGPFIAWQRAPLDREQGASSASLVGANGPNPTSVRKRMSFSQPAAHHSTNSTSAQKNKKMKSSKRYLL